MKYAIVITVAIIITAISRLIVTIVEEPDLTMDKVLERILPRDGQPSHSFPTTPEIRNSFEIAPTQKILLEYQNLHVSDIKILREVKKLIFQEDSPYFEIHKTLEKSSILSQKKLERERVKILTQDYIKHSKDLEKKLLDLSNSCESAVLTKALTHYAKTLREFRTSIKNHTFDQFRSALNFFEENIS